MIGIMSADTNRVFAGMMVAHHGSGIRMARIELKYRDDPKARALTSKIAKTAR